MRAFAERTGLKLGAVAQPLRAALTGRTTSPGIFDVLAVLGRDESLARLARSGGPPVERRRGVTAIKRPRSSLRAAPSCSAHMDGATHTEAGYATRACG